MYADPSNCRRTPALEREPDEGATAADTSTVAESVGAVAAAAVAADDAVAGEVVRARLRRRLRRTPVAGGAEAIVSDGTGVDTGEQESGDEGGLEGEGRESKMGSRSTVPCGPGISSMTLLTGSALAAAQWPDARAAVRLASDSSVVRSEAGAAKSVKPSGKECSRDRHFRTRCYMVLCSVSVGNIF